ncbi:unnamed protein product, partial [Effrenium voratum]
MRSLEKAEDKVALTFVAAPSVRKLGFKTKAFPPRVSIPVVNVDPQGWASKMGIQKGDELIQVQQKIMQLMKPSEFTHVVLNSRPLSLTLARSKTGIGDEETFYHLVLPKNTLPGFRTETLPPQAKVLVGEVEQETWAARMGLEEGHRLLKMDGYSVARMSKEEFMRMLKLVRPLRLDFARGAHFTRWASAKHLGLRLQGTQVLAVDPGFWAESAGVMIGDRLVSIG